MVALTDAYFIILYYTCK